MAHQPDEVHCWELYGRRAVRKGQWKAEYYDAPYGEEEWELYDLSEDIGELSNLADRYPKILEELKKEWGAYAQKYQVTLPSEKVAYGVEEIWREN